MTGFAHIATTSSTPGSVSTVAAVSQRIFDGRVSIFCSLITGVLVVGPDILSPNRYPKSIGGLGSIAGKMVISETGGVGGKEGKGSQ